MRIQRSTATLPEGKGFGFVLDYQQEFPHSSWTGVVRASLARSRDRIAQAGLADARQVDRVEAQLGRFVPYFETLCPRAFLDDTTTKNVIVHRGALSGIVDVDTVCFGDPLFTVALTRMALLNSGYDQEYIRFWCELLELTPEQSHVLQFYTALFCVDFMGELGYAHNKDRVDPADVQKVNHLAAILDDLLAGLARA